MKEASKYVNDRLHVLLRWVADIQEDTWLPVMCTMTVNRASEVHITKANFDIEI